MKKIYILILSVLLSVSVEAAERYRYFLPPSAFSASYSAGSFSSLINPVFTQRNFYPFAAYSFVKEEDAKFSHFASLNILNFDFIYSRYNSITPYETADAENTPVSLYSINRGFLIGNVFGIGAGYSYSSSDHRGYDGCHGWNIGFLLRPARYLSAGGVLRGIEDRESENNKTWSATGSLSIRPFTDKLTLSADATRFNKESGLDSLYTFGAELTPFSGLTLTLKGDSGKNCTFGLTIPVTSRSGGPLITALEGHGGINRRSPDFYSGGISFTSARENESFTASTAGKALHIRLHGNYSNENTDQGFFAAKDHSFHQLLAGIRRGSADSTIGSLILEINSLSFGFGQLQELRDEILRFRKNGKTVYALMSYSGNKEYYLATAADRILFTPNSTFHITGLKMQVYFVKGLLDKAGVKYESVSRGRYKSFNETFTREKMSPEARENMEEVLNDLNSQFMSGISEGRNIPAEKIMELFTAGFYLPEKAKEAGFIDEVVHRDNAIDAISGKSGIVKFSSYIEENERIRGWGALPEIAVVHVNGSIISGRGSDSSISSSTGDYDYRDSLERAFRSSSVKAVVIRVDSGGGSAAASDYMWNHLLLMKKKHPKPVVFSFGNTAASGGYYIACTGDRIFANSGTITGSIGVVAGKISLRELYSRLGISSETIKMSEFADIFSEARELTPEEQELFRRNIEFIYDRFTGRVMEGRKIDASRIMDVAEGKIHTGRGAAVNSLADENGGLMAAIGYALNLGGIQGTYNVIHLPARGGYLRGLMRYSEDDSLLKSIGAVLRTAGKYNFPDEGVLYINPFIIEVE